MARILGIDLGSHAVKLAVFEGSFGRYQLDDYLVRNVAQDIDVEPALDDRLAALGELLDELMGQRWSECAAGFPTQWSSIHRIHLPFSDRDRVMQTLPFEVENQVPFDLDDMVLAPRILDIGDAGSTVLCALAAKDRVRPFLSGLKDLGVDPKALVMDADMLGSVAEHGVQAVVDFGHSRTLVALCRDGRVIGARAISLGGRELTRALAQGLDCSWEEAEGRKHAASLSPAGRMEPPELFQTGASTGPDGASDPVLAEWMDEPTTQISDDDLPLPPPEPLGSPSGDGPGRDGPGAARPDEGTDAFGASRETEILRRAIKPLLVDLRATLISFEDRYSVDIDEILVAGGGGDLHGLRPWLSDLLGVPVRQVLVSDEADSRGGPGRFVISHALALSSTRGGRGHSLDLRRDELAFRGDLATIGNLARYGAVAMVFFLLAGLALFGYRHHQLSAQVDSLDTQIREAVLATFPDVPPDKLKDAGMALAIMQEKTTETTGRVEVLGSIVADEPPMLGLLRDLSDGMPSPSQARIDVRELSVTPTNITMKAETDGYETATRIESALQTRPQFKSARKGDEKKSHDNVRFSITIPREGAETDEG